MISKPDLSRIQQLTAAFKGMWRKNSTLLSLSFLYRLSSSLSDFLVERKRPSMLSARFAFSFAWNWVASAPVRLSNFLPSDTSNFLRSNTRKRPSRALQKPASSSALVASCSSMAWSTIVVSGIPVIIVKTTYHNLPLHNFFATRDQDCPRCVLLYIRVFPDHLYTEITMRYKSLAVSSNDTYNDADCAFTDLSFEVSWIASASRFWVILPDTNVTEVATGSFN